MDHHLTPGRLTCAIGVLFLAVGVCAAQSAGSPPLDLLLERLTGYLADYEGKVFELAAEEQYDQWIKRRSGYGGATVQRRKLKSTYFLVRLPDGQAWYGFRDVTSVDGRAVSTEGRSMSQLLGERTVSAFEEAVAQAHANAKYNIGDVYRTINIPLQALELLLPQYRTRFEFGLAGRERVRGQDTVAVSFRERAAPGLINDGSGNDLLVQGRVWIEPGSGAVWRTELGFSGFAGPSLKDAAIRVEYQHDRRLQVLVPIELEEAYGLAIEVLHGRASYRNYRRFETGGRLVVPPR